MGSRKGALTALYPPVPYPDAVTKIGWGGLLQQPAYRFWVSGVALLIYGSLATLWLLGPHSVYFAILRLFGFEPFRFPFLDIHAIFSAAQCSRLGIDVYRWNPCDALGRPHVYSPLWLAITPSFLDTSATTGVGLGLGALFILSLATMCRPATKGETLLMGFTAVSPITVYALERANNDLVVFLLIVAGGAVLQTRRPIRFLSYSLYLLAGLLKYYPLVLLVMLARERRRDAIPAATIIFSVLLFVIFRDHAELARALKNIPAPSYFADSFGAVNLPFGLAAALAIPLRGTFGVALLTVLALLAVARTWRSQHLLTGVPPDWNAFDTDCMITGALLLIACFLVARNIDYRGIYFVLVMPGLVRLRRICRQEQARRFFSQIIAGVLFVAWEEVVRRLVQTAAAGIPSDGLRARVEILFWLGRELVWWWLVAGLAAIVLSYLRRLPLVAGLGAALAKAPLLHRLAR